MFYIFSGMKGLRELKLKLLVFVMIKKNDHFILLKSFSVIFYELL